MLDSWCGPDPPSARPGAHSRRGHFRINRLGGPAVHLRQSLPGECRRNRLNSKWASRLSSLGGSCRDRLRPVGTSPKSTCTPGPARPSIRRCGEAGRGCGPDGAIAETGHQSRPYSDRFAHGLGTRCLPFHAEDAGHVDSRNSGPANSVLCPLPPTGKYRSQSGICFLKVRYGGIKEGRRSGAGAMCNCGMLAAIGVTISSMTIAA